MPADMFNSNWLPDLFSRAFAELPATPIHVWAESGHGPSPRAPFVLRKSPEPNYRSNRTPWTRRGQDLLRNPWHNGRRVRRFGARKCSRSGFTEGCILNPIRWTAQHRPRNCIVSVDSQKEIANISERLLPTLRDLGQNIFTANDDDVSKFVMRLRGMDIYFSGSFTAGAFSNKTASWVFNDEVDLYGEISAEGDTIENFWSRAKGLDDGFQVVLSKPAMKDGPIDSFYQLGNQEQWEMPCPHCGFRQVLDWDRVTFSHCKDLTGFWDKERILDETFYRCAGQGCEIRNHQKGVMNEAGLWVPTAKGDPEIITQHISDLPSMYDDSSFGHLAKQFVTALEVGDRRLLQTFRQQRLGLGWEEKIQKIESIDVLKLRRPYRRGIIPEAGCRLVAGMDIGDYANNRWMIYACNPKAEMWLIDWGSAEGPRDIIKLMQSKQYECRATGAKQRIEYAFIDARYRSQEVLETCLMAPRVIFPCVGIYTRVGGRSISYAQIKNQPQGLGLLSFVDSDAKFDLYIDTIKGQKPPGLYWPEDVGDQVVREHTAERLIQKKHTNKIEFDDKIRSPNHFGDCTKIARIGFDWLIGGRLSRLISELTGPEPAKETPAPGAFDAEEAAA